MERYETFTYSLHLSNKMIFFIKKGLLHLFTAKAQIIGTVPSSDFSVKENDTISIVCNVDGSPAPTATWTKTTGEFCSILTITFYRKVGEKKFLRGGEGGRIVLGGTVLTECKGGGALEY